MMTTGTTRAALLLGTALAGLAGTALQAQDTGATDLGTLTVEGASYETEGTNSYKSGLISVGEKAAMTPREVPQSTTVITRTQIEDGGYTALETALDAAPGIMILSNDTGRSSIFSRGFEFDYLYYDGLPAPVSSIYGTQPDLSIMDHIEVLKGPSGLFMGTGSPAGSVNMRLKQANRTVPGGSYRFSADENGHARAEIDYGAALNAEGTLRARTVLAWADGDGAVDKQENGVSQVYGTLAWDITPATTATLSFSRMERDIAPFNGLPSYADGSLLWLDPSATSAADWNRFDNEVTDIVAAVEHHFDGGARLKASLRQSWQEGDFAYAYTGSAAAADNSVSRMSWLHRNFEIENLALDLHGELPFALGGMEGMAILGADMQRYDNDLYAVAGNVNGRSDLDDWDVSSFAEPANIDNYTTRTQTSTESRGLYAQLRLKPLQALTLIGGARLSWYESEVTTTTLATGRQSTTEMSENGKVTPYLGVTYDLSPAATLYASYTEIFQPQSALDASGNVLDPMEGQQYELGLKGQLASGLDVSAALFRLEQVNRALAVPGESYSEAEGAVRVQGLELEAAGEIGENLHLAAGYTYTDTEYLNGPSQGAAFSTYTPAHLFKLSAEYEVTQGVAVGWSFGGQLTAMTGFSSVSGGTTIHAPGYGVVDLSAARQIGAGGELRLTLANALDKDYYSRVGGTSVFNFRGAPRTLGVAFTQKF